MEKLTLNKFEDSKLENMQQLTGGYVGYTTLDGQENGDWQHNDQLYIYATGEWHCQGEDGHYSGDNC